MTNAAAELLASKPNVLLDFDGPVCSVFGGVGADTIARQLRDHLGLGEQHSTDVRDPFDILRYAAAEGHREAVEAERELTKLEVEAVASAPPTPGASELLQQLDERGQTVVIVSNNSESAVRVYLDAHGLTPMVQKISARTEADPNLLKPSSHLLDRAIKQLNAAAHQCVMIGDSVADVEAARSAGIAVIALANKQGKGAELELHSPTAIIANMRELPVA